MLEGVGEEGDGTRLLHVAQALAVSAGDARRTDDERGQDGRKLHLMRRRKLPRLPLRDQFGVSVHVETVARRVAWR